MGFDVINNSWSKHRKEVKHLFSRCTKILIASPFVSDEGIDFLMECGPDKFEQVILITTMKAKDGDQYKKVPVLLKLYSLLQQGSSSSILSIHIDDRLHGKVYIGLRGDRFLGAIISSANFTGNGLARNHEWGVYIDDQAEVEGVYNQLLSDTLRTVSKIDLEKMKRWYDSHSVKPSVKTGTDLNVLDLVSSPLVPSRRDSVTYWLKPYGTTDNPVQSTTKFDLDPFDMTFAKGVKNIKEGDVIVVYAVGSKKILSVYVSTGEWGIKKQFNDPRDAHWPHYVVCKNLTPVFGANWYQLNLTLDYLKDAYLKIYPRKNVRPGYQDFRILQWRMDRIKLDRDFTKYVIGEVLKRQ